jgi:hypothetical protein
MESMTRKTGGEQRFPDDRHFDWLGSPLLRTRWKNGFARVVREMQARGRRQRHDLEQEQESADR